jgi:Fe-S-cluster containining protein
MKEEKKVNSFLEENIEGIHEVIGEYIPFLLNIKKTEGAAKAYEVARNQADKLLTQSKLFDHATCSFGCSFCCHDSIYMSGDEGDHIKKIVAEKGIIPNADRIVKQKAGIDVKWIDKACPLLQDEDENGKRLCSIYEDRPLICRAHNSSEDPAKCYKENDPDRVIRELKLVALDGVIMSSFFAGSKDYINGEPQTVKMHELW